MRAWRAPLRAPPLLPRPSLGTCWLLLHSAEGAAEREDLGTFCSKHQWWEGDTMPVPEAQAGSVSLLRPAQRLGWLSWAGGR